MRFPRIEGSSLSKQAFRLPDDLEGQLNVVLVAFQRWHQDEVDTWVPLMNQLEQRVPGFRHYELPVIRPMNRFSQWMLDEGMRAGIPSQSVRERTITVYTDKQQFRQAAQMPDEHHIYVMLVDAGGEVLWQARGAYSEQAGRSLIDTIEKQLIAV
ncbi:MAG: hypothetical protein R2844_02285 [Caldilineales bacterium]